MSYNLRVTMQGYNMMRCGVPLFLPRDAKTQIRSVTSPSLGPSSRNAACCMVASFLRLLPHFSDALSPRHAYVSFRCGGLERGGVRGDEG